jgi:purine-cytosine permease-like protein
MKQNSKHAYTKVTMIGTILVMLCMGLLVLFPSSFIIFSSGIVIPVIIIGLVYWILRSDTESESTPKDDWYEK